MSKVLVCTNVLDSVKSYAYGSHVQEWFRMGRHCKEDEFILFHPERYSIDNARTQAANYAMYLECDYIYFLDDDMTLTPNTFSSLKAADGDVVQALTYIRGYPFDVMAFRGEEKEGKLKLEYFNDYKDHIEANGLVTAYAVGFACALLKVKPLLKLPPPFFVTGTGQTEDVYFCCKLKQYFPESRILVDTKVPTGHLLHNEVVGNHNVEKLRKFYAPKAFEAKGNDRGNEYAEMAKGIFSK